VSKNSASKLGRSARKTASIAIAGEWRGVTILSVAGQAVPRRAHLPEALTVSDGASATAAPGPPVC
jgi:hypothetical protein